MDQAQLDRVRDRLRRAQAICAFTGAGMSAESGIPTFRDAMSGLWSRFDPAELASEDGFRAEPERVWGWYAERREGVRRAQPNAGHLALAAFAARHPGRLTVISQNVDDLHQRAGNVDTIRLHGDILDERWLDRCPRGTACDTACAQPTQPPRCTECGNLVRPGVVWFGEPLPYRAFEAAERAVDACDAMLVIGTSGAVWPAAGLVARARRGSAWVLVLNPQASDVDGEADEVLAATAAQALPMLLHGL